jgi:hypothetical protein
MGKLARKLTGRMRRQFRTFQKPVELDPIIALPREMTGLFARLTPEQKAFALAYRGPEDHGDHTFRVKR